jgi:WS/DGAT/MGAT family acyltransferase
MRQLNGLDRMFLTQETPGAPMHIGMLAFYTQATAPGGRVRFREIVRMFRERAHAVPVLHERVEEAPLGLDNPYWVRDPELNIETHLHHLALPQPGDWRQLCILVARLQARAVDRSRPLWEACVIEGLDNVEFLPKGSFAVFFKMHHAAVDGHAALHAIEMLHDEDPRHPRELPLEPVDDDAPGKAEMLRRAGANFLAMPARWARLAVDTVQMGRRLLPLLREQTPEFGRNRVNTRFNGRISSYRVVETAFFGLDELKAPRAAVPGSTLNDVVVTIIGGALRKYLQARGELGEVSPVTIAPLSFREAGEREFGGNLVSAMAFPVHTGIEDPLARLRAVTKSSAGAKEIARVTGPRTALELFAALPPQLMSVGFLEAGTRLLTATGMASPVNTVITNVAGPKKTLYLAGARMVGIAGFGPIMDSMGLFHAVMSYDGRVSIAVNSCREMMPDPAFYIECIRSAWRELEQASAGRAVGRASARKKTPTNLDRASARQQASKTARRAKARPTARRGARAKA